MKINIYTDGSHLDKLNKGRLGCGGIMVEMPDNDEELGKKIGEFSRELTPEWLEKTLGTKDVSNPTAELLGVLTALETFNIPDNATVEVIADYNGVMGFLSGKWKSREVYIAKVVNKINDTIVNPNYVVTDYDLNTYSELRKNVAAHIVEWEIV